MGDITKDKTAAQFNGDIFLNIDPVEERGLGSILKWMWNRQKAEWPDWIEQQPVAVPVAEVTGDKMRVTFINHSTYLIQADGKNYLTDAIWSDRCSPVSFAGPKRHRPPAIPFDQLPQIHGVFISHNHYDHLDLPTLKRLEEKFHPTFYVGLRVKKLLSSEGFLHVEELDWWESRDLPSGRKVHFVPAQHFSGRGLNDRNGTLWGGFVIEVQGGVVYFAGDTGYGSFFQQIRDRFPRIHLALLPIGAYEPRWFMSPVHMNPEDAVKAHIILKPALSLGMHFGTFQLTDESIEAPLLNLYEALTKHGLSPAEFRAPVFGEPLDFSLKN
ncbi:MAG: MBL fold metallo-hydrolase [Bdellovibrionales bacterium]|nr:MBL fold metallo-hydrolase [Bdellovibrionales bacterium]